MPPNLQGPPSELGMQVSNRVPRRTRRRWRWFSTGQRRINARWLLATVSLVVLAPAMVIWLHAYQSPRNARFLLQQSRSLEEQGQTEEAIHFLELYLGAEPDDVVETRRLGLLLAQSQIPKDRTKARDLLQLSSTDDDMAAQSTLLRLNLQLGYFADALKIAERLETAADVDARRLQWIAEAYEVNGRGENALSAIQRAVALDPTSLTAYARYLRLLYHSTYNVPDLEKAISKMLQDASDRPLAELLAYTILRNEKLPGADAHLHKALELAPNNVEVLLMAAGDGFASNPMQAGQWLKQAYQASPEDRRVLLTYGKWLLWSGQLQKALSLFEAGFRQDKDNPDFAWRAAETLVELGRFDDAKDYLEVLLDYPEYLAASRFVRGRGALLQGNISSAKEDFLSGQSLIQHVGDELGVAGDRNEIAFKLDLGMAGVEYHEGHLSSAIRWARDARERLPAESAPLVALGQMYFEQGDFPQSEQAWSQALDCPFVPPGAVIGLARTILAQIWEQPVTVRNVQSVLDLVERARGLIPNDPNIPLIESDAYWAAGNLDRAGQILIAARQAHPQNEAIAITGIRLLLAAGQIEKALEQVEDYESVFGRTLDAILARAIALVQRRSFDEALALLQTAESTLPSTTKGTLRRLQGQVLWLHGRTQEAGERFREACQLDPQDDVAWVFRWIWLNAAGSNPEIEQWIDSAKRERGDATPVWRWAEAMRIDRTDPSAARDRVSKLAGDMRRHHPFRWETIHVSGLEMELAGNADGAIRSYLRALPRGLAPPQLANPAFDLLTRENRAADAQGVLAVVRQQRLPLPQDASVGK